MPYTFFFRFRSARPVFAGALFSFLIALSAVFSLSAQVPVPSDNSASTPAADRGRILLVLPFDNRTGQPNLEWVREAAADLLSSRFRSVGLAPMSRADRMYALELGAVVTSGAPAQVLNDERVLASYLSATEDVLARSDSTMVTIASAVRSGSQSALNETSKK